jgi:hypothetical protein
MSDQLWMLIAGSMKASPRMEQYAVSVTKRAMEKRHFIIVGDNPQGVDRIVAETLIEAEYKDWIVTSVAGEIPRSMKSIVTGKPVGSTHRFEDYHERDVVMCNMADEGMFIWDGQSKGTVAGFEYMKSQNQTAYLADFSQMNGGQPTLSVHKEAIPEPEQVVIPKQKRLI